MNFVHSVGFCKLLRRSLNGLALPLMHCLYSLKVRLASVASFCTSPEASFLHSPLLLQFRMDS